MGCFDTVRVPCPSCGQKADFQSKGGECWLETYELENCPPDVMSDINRHSPYTCAGCGTVFAVKVQVTATSVVVKSTIAILPPLA